MTKPLAPIKSVKPERPWTNVDNKVIEEIESICKTRGFKYYQMGAIHCVYLPSKFSGGAILESKKPIDLLKRLRESETP